MAKEPSLEVEQKNEGIQLELANADDVRAYIRKVQMAIDDLEDLLHTAPPLRFAMKSTIEE